MREKSSLAPLREPVQFEALKADDEFLIELDAGVWLMDDHRWALHVWDSVCRPLRLQPVSLVHADYHWDAVNDFHSLPEEERKLQYLDADALFQIIKAGELIRYDSFIAPAVIRGLVSDLHFFCKQENVDAGLDPDLLRRYGVKQTFHRTADSLSAAQFERPVVFDLCLDLFNRSDVCYQGDIWPAGAIKSFLESARAAVLQADLVTISLSFGYSGTADDTRRLAELIVPTLQKWRLDGLGLKESL